jgi:hypothetical protein
MRMTVCVRPGSFQHYHGVGIALLICCKCALPHLIEAHQIGYVCEECQVVSKLQKGASPVLKLAA